MMTRIVLNPKWDSEVCCGNKLRPAKFFLPLFNPPHAYVACLCDGSSHDVVLPGALLNMGSAICADFSEDRRDRNRN